MTPAAALAAMRADTVPAPAARGLWHVVRHDYVSRALQSVMDTMFGWGSTGLPYHSTKLCRWTDATLHLETGEIVMSDDPRELKRHLPVVLAARGRVLVSGLGLGCVVRGLLSNPQVDAIDVLENSAEVLALVGPTVADPRVRVHHADALRWRAPRGVRYDCAWHDVWSVGDVQTNQMHLKLIDRYRRICGRQGAWNLPRPIRRSLARSVRLLA